MTVDAVASDNLKAWLSVRNKLRTPSSTAMAIFVGGSHSTAMATIDDAAVVNVSRALAVDATAALPTKFEIPIVSDLQKIYEGLLSFSLPEFGELLPSEYPQDASNPYDDGEKTLNYLDQIENFKLKLEAQFDVFGDVSSFFSKHVIPLGSKSVTNFVEAGAVSTAGSETQSASASMLAINAVQVENQAVARIGKGALINQAAGLVTAGEEVLQDVSVTATSTAKSINWARTMDPRTFMDKIDEKLNGVFDEKLAGPLKKAVAPISKAIGGVVEKLLVAVRGLRSERIPEAEGRGEGQGNKRRIQEQCHGRHGDDHMVPGHGPGDHRRRRHGQGGP